MTETACAGDLSLRSEAAELPAPRRSGRVAELEQQLEKLRSRLRIAIVYGGDKSDAGAVINQTVNPRSWKSYRQVAQDISDALSRLGFRHVQLVPDDMRLGDRLRRDETHFAWLNTGGVQGYNPMSHAAAMLEMFGIPYVGHDPLTAGTLDSKDAFKRNLSHVGIPTAPFMTWHLARGPFRPKVNGQFIRVFRDHWGSYIVKPVSGRASLHVHLVEREIELPEVVEQVFAATQNHVMIEAYLPGREYCVAVCGQVVAKGGQLLRSGAPFVFSEIERLLEADEAIFTSMDIRPITQDRVRVLDGVADEAERRQLQELARRVFVEMNLESVIRLDIRENDFGQFQVLEANPKPDLKAPGATQTSLVCTGLESHGMTYDDLILTLLADRIDLLFCHKRGSVARIAELLS